MGPLTRVASLFVTFLWIASALAQEAPVSAVSGASSSGRTQNQEVVPAGCNPILGQPNYIPFWLNATVLGSSVMYQDPNTKNVGVGTNAPTATLDVNGGINTPIGYRIGGAPVLNVGNVGGENTFVGVGAGAENATGFENTFVGSGSGNLNTSGQNNTFIGSPNGTSNTTGYGNTFLGSKVGISNTTGNNDTFVGFGAGGGNTQGNFNTFIGGGAGFNSGNASDNTFVGFEAGAANNGTRNTLLGEYAAGNNGPGSDNTIIGFQAGVLGSYGSNNIFVGSNAGFNLTAGNNNIYLGNRGPQSGNEFSTIRVGDPSNQTFAYVAGVWGATINGGVPVYVNQNGQLGTQPSSLRFKEQVTDMGDTSNALMALRPVTFLYKPEYDKGKRTLQYGLIAEEVAQVYPELVADDKDGRPYSVRYQYLATMLLNETQKQYHRAEAQAQVIKAQDQKIEALEQRLSRLEMLIETQTNVASNSIPVSGAH